MRQTDLAIIGAGPAGMAAADTAAAAGLNVILLDEQARPGGQIYRDVDRVGPLRGDLLGPDYLAGRRLTAALSQDGINHIHGAVVWAIEEGSRIHYTGGDGGGAIQAKNILIATGALERPMPLPGWARPGVMTAGAAQILLKQSGVLPRRAVLVGAGPLLYLIAAQMVRAGVPPVALVETQTRADTLRGLRHVAGALRGWRYLLKGVSMLREIRRAGVPRYTGVSGITIEGEERAEAVCFTAGGAAHRLDCETVLLHHGVVPNTQAARSVGIAHRWDAQQACFVPELDAWGRSDLRTVYVAGDGAGIGGAAVAAVAGRLAALDIARDLGRITLADRDGQAVGLRRALHRERAIRPFLDTVYPPAPEALHPADTTTICRCEEVTAGEIRRQAARGCRGPNQAKAFGRAGMGPCQGRFCGLTVTNLLSEANNATQDETGYFRIRPPLKPVTLGELAALTAPQTPGTLTEDKT